MSTEGFTITPESGLLTPITIEVGEGVPNWTVAPFQLLQMRAGLRLEIKTEGKLVMSNTSVAKHLLKVLGAPKGMKVTQKRRIAMLAVLDDLIAQFNVAQGIEEVSA